MFLIEGDGKAVLYTGDIRGKLIHKHFNNAKRNSESLIFSPKSRVVVG